MNQPLLRGSAIPDWLQVPEAGLVFCGSQRLQAPPSSAFTSVVWGKETMSLRPVGTPLDELDQPLFQNTILTLHPTHLSSLSNTKLMSMLG